MSESLRISVGQCVSLVGRVDENLALADRLCEQASREGADVVLFPESHATGYSYHDLRSLIVSTAETMTGAIVRRLSGMAGTHGLVVCCGMFEREGSRFFNTQVVAFPDGRVEQQRKGEAEQAEAQVVTLDPVRKVFEWKQTRFGVLVCADNAIKDYREQFEALDISLLLHPCAGRILVSEVPEQSEARSAQDELFEIGSRLAATTGMTYAVANPIGFSGEDYYPGNSWIVRPDGAFVRSPSAVFFNEPTPSLVSISMPERLCVETR